MLLGEQQSRVFEYVTVPGIGYPSDYDALRSSGIDISGKIALVKRGTSSFEDKASAAYAAGAAGIIIYNNTTGMIRMSIGKNLDIAACSINKEVGDILASRQTEPWRSTEPTSQVLSCPISAPGDLCPA